MGNAVKILGAVAAVGVLAVGGLVAVVAMQPSEFHMERSHVVAAQPQDVWPHVADLHAFTKWSPWEELDPNQTTEFSDPASGVGAWYTWKGNDQVGSGKMTITAANEPSRVEHDLEFIEPFASKADVFLAIEAAEGGTKITWGFDSENDFMGKAFSMMVDMDAMLGADFEKGLGKLATLAEADAKAREDAEAKAAAEAAAAAEVPADAVAEQAPPN